MGSSRAKRALPLVLGTLLLTILPLSISPVAHACINPPSSCTTPDFLMMMESPNTSVNQGSPGTAGEAVYVETNAYFSGTINLTAAILPTVIPGPSVTLETPTLYTGPSVNYVAWVLMSASLNTPLGNYTVTITGVSASLTRNASFTLTVSPPIPPEDFSMWLAPPYNLQQGDQSDATIAVDRAVSGVLDDLTVYLSLTITPSDGITVSGFPTSVTITPVWDGIRAGFTVQTSTTTPPGVYTLNVTGTNYSRSQALSHSASATMSVIKPPYLEANPSSLTGIPGIMSSSIITLVSQGGSIGLYSLSAETSQTGISATFNGPGITTTQSSSMEVFVNTGTPPGTYWINITATKEFFSSGPGPGPQTLTLNVPIVVTALDFYLAPSTTSISFAVGSFSNTSFTITTDPITGPVTLTLSSPQNLSCNLDRTTIQSAAKATVSCTSNTPGDYAVTVTATAGSVTHQATITVHVIRASATTNTIPLSFLSIPVLVVEYVAGALIIMAVAGIIAIAAISRRKPKP